MRPWISSKSGGCLFVRATEDQITAYVEEQKRSLAYRRAQTEAKYVSVSLIGPPKPIPCWHGGNALRWPVSLRTGADPLRAAHRTRSEHWEGSKSDPRVVTLAHVWTLTSAHAKRLEDALYECMLGDDPDLRQLNGSWIDLPEWQIAWPVLIQDAVTRLYQGGQTIEIFDEDGKFERLLDRVRRKTRR